MRALLVVAAFVCIPGAAAERSRAAVRDFRTMHACPATASHRGPCPGFQVDHVSPLCAGGDDAPSNMQWISVDDHRFKTLVDVRECRKLRRAAGTPAK